MQGFFEKLQAWRRLAAAGASPFAAGWRETLGSRGVVGADGALPLESCRTLPHETEDPAARLFRGGTVVRVFRSSGTTQASRSTSRFSEAGLAAYREQSVYTFRHVLQSVLPVPPAEARGLSLVPPVGVWGESSLAQMIGWLQEELPLTYVDEASLARAVEEAEGRPVWLFGTAFHLVALLDHGNAVALPPGSMVIETGGTKGRSREVTRTEFYAELAEGFGVAEEAIVSEYGMCELACQAYDFVPRGKSAAAGERRFRFPEWVRTAALTGPGRMTAAGRGALVVDDPLRGDFPWALRTEDLADVQEDGFRLLGRAPTQPLKGCSLAAEDLLQSKPSAPPSLVRSSAARTVRLQTTERRTRDGGTEGIKVRCQRLARLVPDFLASPATEALLAKELGSRAAARAALDDTLSALPRDIDSWFSATERATGGACPARWLFILPENHSLVGLYPLALAHAAGLDVTVRMPARYHVTANLLRRFVDLLAVKTVGPEFRLGGSPLDVDAVLAFGSDETIAQLRAATSRPVQGFGNRFGVSVACGEQSPALVDAVVRDALGLGQTGCMSTRLVVTTWHDETFAEAGSRFWDAPLPWGARIALDFEAFRLTRLGFTVQRPRDERTPLVAFRDVDASTFDLRSLPDLIARAPFTLPVLRVSESGCDAFVKALVAHLGETRALGTLTHFGLKNTGYPDVSFRALGKANAVVWDGCHEMRAIFTVT